MTEQELLNRIVTVLHFNCNKKEVVDYYNEITCDSYPLLVEGVEWDDLGKGYKVIERE